MTNEIVISNNLSIYANKIEIFATYLEFNQPLTFEEFQDVFNRLKNKEDALHKEMTKTQFYLGDLMLHGEKVFGEDASQIFDALDYEKGYKANMAWVARSIEPSRRRENLSWSHHQEVAGLEKGKQDIWLNLATNHDWNKSKLREEIKKIRDEQKETEKEKKPMPLESYNRDQLLNILLKIIRYVKKYPKEEKDFVSNNSLEAAEEILTVIYVIIAEE